MQETRVILIGASNLTLGFPLVLHLLQPHLDKPLQFYAAAGHGRSYGAWSRVLFRGLPGILQCDLWPRLDAGKATSGRTLALMTDVGNDLVYGASVETITAWVESCLDRLAEQRAKIILTLLPLSSVERLSAWRYHLTRAIFFPGNKAPWKPMLQKARELNDQLIRLGNRDGVQTVEPPLEWYGFDPIHIRRRHRIRAWRHIVSQWPSVTLPTSRPRYSTKSALRLWTLPPAERTLFGRRQTAPQPAYHFPDGTPLFLY